jgi:hypothetical protein
MMSAAIAMLAGVEQTKGRPVSGDLFSAQGEQEDVSFAKSLSESVGAAASSEAKNAVGDLAIALSGLKGTTPAKSLEEVAEKPGEGEEKSIPVHEAPVQSELKGTVAGRIALPQVPTVTGGQEKIASGTATKVEVPVHEQWSADDVSAGYPIPEGTGVSDETPAQQVNLADGSQPLAPSVSSGDSPAVWTGTKTAEIVREGVSLKKCVKAQESAVTQKTVQKPAGKIVTAISVEAKPATGISPESASAVVGQVAPAVVPTVTLQAEISQATEPAYRLGTSQAKLATVLSPAAVDGQARKDIASGAKAGVTDTATSLAAASDPVATAKTETSQQRIAAIAIPAGSDGENKPHTAGGNGAALLHSVGVVPTAGVSGSTPGELASTHIVSGNTGRHLGGLPAGSTGQDGAGVATQSTDGTPRMLAATPTSLEVGIQNGTHGWLKVRAEMADGGVVNASVSAASSAGQEMLHRELPALTAYLQQEKVTVNAVTVHAASAAGADARSSSGADGAGGQTPPRSNDGEQQQQSVRKMTLSGSDGKVSYRGLHGFGEDGSLPLAAYVNGGTWLSVRA